MKLREAVSKFLKVHWYYCKSCELEFMVDQKFEDQSVITCPSCKKDNTLDDSGEGIVVRNEL
jgi:predicted nucleic acid-binding Zn ribbon protein